MATHINAYLQDVDDAYLKAQQALSALKDTVDRLSARYEEDRADNQGGTNTDQAFQPGDDARTDGPQSDPEVAGPGVEASTVPQEDAKKSSDNKPEDKK